MERVTISMIWHSFICKKGPIDIVLDDKSKDKNVYIDFQH